MLISLSFKKEHLWLRVLSVNDERETVAGRVLSHPFNPGLKFGQKSTFRLTKYMIFFSKNKM